MNIIINIIIIALIRKANPRDKKNKILTLYNILVENIIYS